MRSFYQTLIFSAQTALHIIYINAETSSFGSVFDLPYLSASDIIEIYFLQSSFSYDTSHFAKYEFFFNRLLKLLFYMCLHNLIWFICSYRPHSGLLFPYYEMAHSGIGIWDLNTGIKLSIEFVSNNAYNSIIPALENGYINWNNSGSIVVTNPLDQVWSSSRLIASTTGVAYQTFSWFSIASSIICL